MKKLRVMFMITIIGMSTMMYGCEKEEEPVQQQEEVKGKEDTKEEPVKEEQEEPKEEEKDETVADDENETNATTVTATNMKIYYADPGTGEILGKEVEGSNVTPEMVWEQLKKEGVITAECGMNQFMFHDAEKKMDLDVNGAFGSYIRGMGTSGEDITITCITRSYLETYGYEGIKITEDGKVLETGHAVLDGYIEVE